MDTDNKQLVKLVIIGAAESGKSSLFSRLINQGFTETHVKTTGVNIQSLELDIHNVKLRITDTTSDEKYWEIIANTYLIKQDIYYLVIDPTGDVEAQLKQVHQQIHTSTQLENKACFVFVITKMDLITTQAAKRKLTENLQVLTDFGQGSFDFSIKEVSAKDNTGINALLDFSVNHAVNLKIFAKLKESALNNVCEKYAAIIKSFRFFSTDISRHRTLRTLREKLNTANNIEDIKDYLINAAKDIRKPINGIPKYGFSLFCGWCHIGSYKNSKLYQFIENELKTLDPQIKLDNVSSPPGPHSVVPLAELRR
jgi:small GTP-binding protein